MWAPGLEGGRGAHPGHGLGLALHVCDVLSIAGQPQVLQRVLPPGAVHSGHPVDVRVAALADKRENARAILAARMEKRLQDLGH